jgi:poly-gamma-glutamate capsule biosynthesis protein CapA/YwtB (metallophosphatase superfamily)
MRWPLVVATACLCACTATPSADPEPRTTPSVSPTPTLTPTPTPAPEPPTEISLTVVGDIMLSRGVAAAHTDPTTTLRGLQPLLRRADVTVGNLESTLSTDGAPTQGDDSFGASPEVLTGLRRAGFDVLSLANNHTGDYGEAALVQTVRAFDGSGITQFGAGRDLAQASEPAIVERDGVTVGFLGFNAIGETPQAGPAQPGALSVRMPPRTGPLDRDDLRHVLRAIRQLDTRVDAVVVLPHWGTQYTHVPEPIQHTVGRRLVDAGADLVVGGHPHWVQGLERHRGVTIAHSLGNAVFDMDFMDQTMEGVVLTATVSADGVGDIELAPYRMDATFAPSLVRGAAARAILADVRSGR